MEIPQKSEKIQNVAKSFPPQRSAKEVIDSSGETNLEDAYLFYMGKDFLKTEK